jgi:hypothetical protein
VTSPPQRPIEYQGEPLDAERGPGLGCFQFQVVVLVVFIVLTPLTVAWDWPIWISVLLLFAVIVLLLVAGQTIIFLLRLVAADRRTRRQPLGSATKTVGQIEDEATAGSTAEAAGDAGDAGNDAATDAPTADDTAAPSGDRDTLSDEGPVRQ